MMADRDWTAAGHGWQGKAITAVGGLEPAAPHRSAAPQARSAAGDPRAHAAGAAAAPENAEVGSDREVWEYAALVTSLDSEILTLGQLYRDRGDCENAFEAN